MRCWYFHCPSAPQSALIESTVAAKRIPGSPVPAPSASNRPNHSVPPPSLSRPGVPIVLVNELRFGALMLSDVAGLVTALPALGVNVQETARLSPASVQ